MEASDALETGTLVVAAHPNTLIRDLMEAVRRLVRQYTLPALERNAVYLIRLSFKISDAHF